MFWIYVTIAAVFCPHWKSWVQISFDEPSTQALLSLEGISTVIGKTYGLGIDKSSVWEPSPTQSWKSKLERIPVASESKWFPVL